MRNVMIASTLIAFAATGSIAADRNIIPNATPTGPTVSCIQSSSISETRVHGNQTIDFVMRNRKVYRNRLPYSCPSLGAGQPILYKTQTNELCSVDVVTILTSPGLTRGPSCGLGKFQPVELEKKSNR